MAEELKQTQPASSAAELSAGLKTERAPADRQADAKPEQKAAASEARKTAASEARKAAASEERKPSASKEEEKDATEQAARQEEFQALIRGRYREDYLRHAAALLAEQAEQTNRYLAYRELKREADELRRTYPDFDLNRELEDPTFARLIRNRVDPATAYEVVHRRELSEAADRRARAERHPVENGLDRAAAPAVLRTDPRALSPEERRQLRRRAARGEEIVW